MRVTSLGQTTMRWAGNWEKWTQSLRKWPGVFLRYINLHSKVEMTKWWRIQVQGLNYEHLFIINRTPYYWCLVTMAWQVTGTTEVTLPVSLRLVCLPTRHLLDFTPGTFPKCLPSWPSFSVLLLLLLLKLTWSPLCLSCLECPSPSPAWEASLKTCSCLPPSSHPRPSTPARPPTPRRTLSTSGCPISSQTSIRCTGTWLPT